MPGPTEFLVNDAHYLMQNLRPERLHGRASLISGKHKPLYMMEGLDASFDAAFLVSYHGSISAPTAVLSHTYNPSVVYHAELNGHVVGESGINALVARHYDVPIALDHRRRRDGRGDAAASHRTPSASSSSARSRASRPRACTRRSPASASARARRARSSASGRWARPQIALPATLDVQLTTSDYAELGTWLHGVERTGPRSLRIVDDEPLRLYRTWVALVALTRAIREQE